MISPPTPLADGAFAKPRATSTFRGEDETSLTVHERSPFCAIPATIPLPAGGFAGGLGAGTTGGRVGGCRGGGGGSTITGGGSTTTGGGVACEQIPFGDSVPPLLFVHVFAVPEVLSPFDSSRQSK